MARRKARKPVPSQSQAPGDDPDRELTEEEFDWYFERLWRAAAWHSGFGRAACNRAACRRAQFCAGPRQPPRPGEKWAGRPVCVNSENHPPIHWFLRDWGAAVPEHERVCDATFRKPTFPGGPTPLDPEEARARLAQWYSDGTLIRQPYR